MEIYTKYKKTDLKKSLWCVALFTVMLGSSAQAEDVRKMVLCKNGKAVRTIRVEKDHRDNTGWITTYSKGGADEVKGDCLNPNSCDDVLERMKKSIEDVGWSCRPVQSMGVERTSSSQ